MTLWHQKPSQPDTGVPWLDMRFTIRNLLSRCSNPTSANDFFLNIINSQFNIRSIIMLLSITSNAASKVSITCYISYQCTIKSSGNYCQLTDLLPQHWGGVHQNLVTCMWVCVITHCHCHGRKWLRIAMLSYQKTGTFTPPLYHPLKSLSFSIPETWYSWYT